MKVDRLRYLSKNIEQTLKTQPALLLKQDIRSKTQQKYPSLSTLNIDFELECALCSQVKRQNYQLKQQLYETQEKAQKDMDRDKQLCAMKQLYDLKCQQLEFVEKELNQQKQNNSHLQNKIEHFCVKSVNTLKQYI